jgi:hypothetical protein
MNEDDDDEDGFDKFVEAKKDENEGDLLGFGDSH